MSGWYIPPADGNYVFFLSSDDDSDLFLSTDATAANKKLIAQENAWSATREWTNSSGGSILSQKRSDQWTNDLEVAPYSGGIALLAGHAYYIEADQAQGGGGDNLAILAAQDGCGSDEWHASYSGESALVDHETDDHSDDHKSAEKHNGVRRRSAYLHRRGYLG